MTCLFKVVGILSATAILFFAHVITANGQTAESLSQVKKVFVDSLGTEHGATELRDAMIKALHKNSYIQVVATASEADAVIRGNGKIWETGSIRIGLRGSISQKTYDGYLQAEIKGKGDKTLWSQRVTPSRFPWDGIVWDLASHFANDLTAALRQNRSVGPTAVLPMGLIFRLLLGRCCPPQVPSPIARS
jgi:hypothetical protein